MLLKDIMTKNPEEVPVIESVMDAAEKMKELNVGAIPVFKNDKVVGIVTDRDIAIRAVAEGKDPKDTPVMDIMSRNIISCPENTDLKDAAHIMEQNKVRRLIVTDQSGKAVGIVSLGDIATKAKMMDIGFEVLEKVSEPSRPAVH
ncbi:MAG TPA: CBS domain-containing protein [Deltaproteobacteria bacterium]|jgi:CBS domain-containing protein|nr:CBS domain-containing protein [Deltaproteobacteria bacterium]HQJ08930.1 CBS domain-containing protein [Deltaproteobacteria bacterium]